MKKAQKVTLVENLIAELGKARNIILADITGIRVNDQNKLRRMLTGVDAKLLVIKNTLLSRAISQSPIHKSLITDLIPSLTGQTAIILSESNEVEPVQVLGKFIKELEMPRLKIGIINGNIYDESALIKISKLPGREVLVAQLVGSLMSPLYSLVGTLQGNMQKLVYVLSTKSEALNSKQ